MVLGELLGTVQAGWDETEVKEGQRSGRGLEWEVKGAVALVVGLG